MADTVAVHHPRDPTRPTVIPADRYDPEHHKLWDPEPVEEPREIEDREAPNTEEVEGLPDGYWTSRSGSFYSVFAPDGEMIDRVQGKEAAVEAARSHGGVDADS